MLPEIPLSFLADAVVALGGFAAEGLNHGFDAELRVQRERDGFHFCARVAECGERGEDVAGFSTESICVELAGDAVCRGEFRERVEREIFRERKHDDLRGWRRNLGMLREPCDEWFELGRGLVGEFVSALSKFVRAVNGGGRDGKLGALCRHQINFRRAKCDDGVATAFQNLPGWNVNAERSGRVIAELGGDLVAAISLEAGLHDALLDAGDEFGVFKLDGYWRRRW